MKSIERLVGEEFGRLKVLKASANRNACGEIFWICQCQCGAEHQVTSGNLTSGSVRSCGCLARELSSQRRKAARRLPKICRHDGCKRSTEKGGYGYCGMHAQRVRRYGNPDYLTPLELWRKNNRAAQVSRIPEVKATTYRKLFGRHEHRVVAEALLGRPLRADEHVHHIDQNKHNNAPENLLVLSASDHLALHAKLRRQ